jgi:hypothetical protein
MCSAMNGFFCLLQLNETKVMHMTTVVNPSCNMANAKKHAPEIL